jgi:hypothetical protein
MLDDLTRRELRDALLRARGAIDHALVELLLPNPQGFYLLRDLAAAADTTTWAAGFGRGVYQRRDAEPDPPAA